MLIFLSQLCKLMMYDGGILRAYGVRLAFFFCTFLPFLYITRVAAIEMIKVRSSNACCRLRMQNYVDASPWTPSSCSFIYEITLIFSSIVEETTVKLYGAWVFG